MYGAALQCYPVSDSREITELDSPDSKLSVGALEYLLFVVGKGLYAIDILDTFEIARPVRLTRLPHVPADVLGVMNLRGNIVPVIDLEQRFHGTYTEPGPDSRIVVVQHDGRFHGFFVARVNEVVRLPTEAVEEAGVLAMSERFVRAVGRHAGRMFLILSMETLLTNPEHGH